MKINKRKYTYYNTEKIILNRLTQRKDKLEYDLLLLYKNWKNNDGYTTLNNFYKSEFNKINLLLKFLYRLKNV
jgi:hypothetical protein